MNCSLVQPDFVIVGCRDRKIFVLSRPNLEQVTEVNISESAHCICLVKN